MTEVLFHTDDDNLYVPPNVHEKWKNIVNFEKYQSQLSETNLTAAWKEVEQAQECNDKREAMLEELRAELDQFSNHEFWNPERLKIHFGLESIIEELHAANSKPPKGSSAAEAAELAAAQFDELMNGQQSGRGRSPPRSREAARQRSAVGIDEEEASMGSPSASRFGGGARSSVASTMRTSTGASQVTEDIAKLERMNPKMPKSAADEVAPMRRCLAPVLRARDKTPIEFTLLLNALDQMQKRLKPIEALIGESKYQLPLHIPFVHIASHIRHCMIPQSTGHHLEEFCDTEYSKRLNDLKSIYESLTQETQSKTVYELLTKETIEREELHDIGITMVKEAYHVEQELKTQLSSGQKKLSENVEQALSVVQDHADKVSSSSNDVIEEVHALERKGAEAFDEISKERRSELKDIEYKMKQSRVKQEKTRRQIRELFKGLKKEQTEYEESCHRFGEIVVEMKRTATAFDQFKVSCEERLKMLADAQATCSLVTTIIDSVSKEARTGVKECQLQMQRMATEEHFRKMRLAKKPLENMQGWYRAVGDLKSIRTHRMEELVQRMAGSWQLEFLLHNERDIHKKAIEEFEVTTRGIQSHFAGLTALLVELEVPVPVLQQIDKDPVVIRTRKGFTLLEGAGKEKLVREAQIRAAAESAEPLALPPVPPQRRLRKRRESEGDIFAKSTPGLSTSAASSLAGVQPGARSDSGPLPLIVSGKDAPPSGTPPPSTPPANTNSGAGGGGGWNTSRSSATATPPAPPPRNPAPPPTTARKSLPAAYSHTV